jgi:hypothetical protein
MPKYTILATGLSPSSLGIRQVGSLAEGEATVRLLQALSALIRSPLVDESAAPGSKAARKVAAKAGIAEPRRVRFSLSDR